MPKSPDTKYLQLSGFSLTVNIKNDLIIRMVRGGQIKMVFIFVLILSDQIADRFYSKDACSHLGAGAMGLI
jgi:hypothetical protein